MGATNPTIGIGFSEKEIKDHLEEWLKIGKSTDPIDESRIRKDVDLLYSCGGFNPPKEIVIVDSPKAFIDLDISIDDTWDQMVQIWVQIWDQTREQLLDQIEDQIWVQILGQIEDQIEDQIWEQIWGQIQNQIWGQLGGQTGHQIGHQIGNSYIHQLAYYSFFEKEIDISKLAGQIALAKNAGWYIAERDKIIISQRPSRLIWKNSKCVHIEFPDGFTVTKLSALEQLAMGVE